MRHQKSSTNKTTGKNKGRYQNNSRYLFTAILSLIAFAASLIILIQKKTQFADALCTITQSNCSTVQNSQYATTLGLDNAWYGIIGFIVLGFLALWQLKRETENRRKLILAGSAFAGIASVYFLFLQAFVLHAYCVYCIIVDISSLIILGSALTILLKSK